MIEALRGEHERAIQLRDSVPEHVGMFNIKTANRTIMEAAQRPDPESLWKSLWYEGEVCCLFADSNLGKSIYAVQIAASVAEKQKVLYFDFELSDKQFQLRYTDEATGKCHKFPDNLYRVEINPDGMDGTSYEDALMTNIEGAALSTGAKVLIIDNLTYLNSTTEKGDVAGALMIRLMQLKRKHGLSMLILAHTPKRPLTNPITQNDLAGSKKLYNFFDSVFAIGKSAKDNNLRYIKQVKVRYGSYTYDSGNVIVAAIEKVDSFLQFVSIGFATEREHLREPTEKEATAMDEQIRAKARTGISYRTIASELGISYSKVQRVMKK
jgi:hypothetical protein